MQANREQGARVVAFPRTPAERADRAQVMRAAAVREVHPNVRLRMRQRSARPGAILTATNPLKSHPLDAVMRWTDDVVSAKGTAADTFRLVNACREYAIARVGAVARSVARLRVELTRTWAEATVADAEAMADGRMTPREAARLADEFREVRDTLDEAILALTAVAQDNGRTPPPEAA